MHHIEYVDHVVVPLTIYRQATSIRDPEDTYVSLCLRPVNWDNDVHWMSWNEFPINDKTKKVCKKIGKRRNCIFEK